VLRRAFGAALVVLAATAHEPARAADASPPVGLHAVTARYEKHLLSARPDLASRAGHARADDRLEPVTEATLERDAAELGEIEMAAAAIDRAPLGAREHEALDTLRARAGRELAALREGTWRTDPDAYLALAHAAPLEAAARPRIGACERARRVAARLRAVPEVLRAAEVNLRDARGFDRDAAVAKWRAAMMDLRLELPKRFDACHDGERFAAFVEADTLALGAMDRFARFLGGNPGALHDRRSIR
jgi:hypothetical protein